jgi:hypothetical protein
LIIGGAFVGNVENVENAANVARRNGYHPSMTSLDVGGGVPPAVAKVLVQTRSWIQLTAVLVAAWLGFWALAAIAYIAVAAVGDGSLKVVGGVPVLIVCAGCAVPVVMLLRYARNIQRLEDGGGLTALESALRNQHGFWKYLAVLVLVGLFLFTAALLAGIFILPHELGSLLGAPPS